MKKQIILIVAITCLATTISAQSDTTLGTFWKPNPRNYIVKQAFEVESLIPMFLTGGYHFGVGYRYKNIRVRASIINGGTYNVDVQAISGTIEGYRRYYTTSPGFFLGYNVLKNLEVYGYYERHTFKIEQMLSGEKQNLPSNDYGIGMSYQFFIGRILYIQPGIHTYFRAGQNINFNNGGTYAIPTFEISPIVRLGARLWRKY
jgi:hypothetical protein